MVFLWISAKRTCPDIVRDGVAPLRQLATRHIDILCPMDILFHAFSLQIYLGNETFVNLLQQWLDICLRCCGCSVVGFVVVVGVCLLGCLLLWPADVLFVLIDIPIKMIMVDIPNLIV